MIKKITLIVLLVFCFSVLTGCNTFRGMGKDIESLGNSMQKASSKSDEK